MIIKKRKPKEIKENLKIISKHSFGFQDLQNKIRAKYNKSKEIYFIQKPTRKTIF